MSSEGIGPRTITWGLTPRCFFPSLMIVTSTSMRFFSTEVWTHTSSILISGTKSSLTCPQIPGITPATGARNVLCDWSTSPARPVMPTRRSLPPALIASVTSYTFGAMPRRDSPTFLPLSQRMLLNAIPSQRSKARDPAGMAPETSK